MNRMARFAPGHAFTADFAFGARTIRFWCDLRNSLAREVFFLGSYAPQETLLLPALLRRGDTCVEVGADTAYGKLQDPSALLKPLQEGVLDSWPHVLASREASPFA
jgi:hypothetical protein